MEYIDARRLTGPNLLWDRAGSILDVACTPDDVETVLALWTDAVTRMLRAVGWERETLRTHTLDGGVSLAFSAPIDALYAASEINEYAFQVIASHVGETDEPEFDSSATAIRQAIREEVNPPLLELAAAAEAHDVAFLWDDDEVSVGHGNGSQVWPFRELPAPDDVEWTRHHNIPVGLVTGTNGKTTTVRLATHIARQAGHDVGVSCTDWVAVNDRIIDRGDWSGPGGARMVLRQPDVDLAILECARGGLLRRGLGVNVAQAALITNIAEDHLGDFGSRSLSELLDVKWVVSHAVEQGGTLVLNADDERLVAKAADYRGELVWFSLNAGNPLVARHIAEGGIAFVLEDNQLLRVSAASRDLLCRSEEISITLGGAARHNVANALAGAALTEALGVSIDNIRRGLKTVTQDDNPGRCNVYELDGVTVLVDFAHNPAAMQSLFDMARALPAERRLLAFGQAGDRTDQLIEGLARSASSIGLDAVVISELADYRRGREPGEVFGIIRNELIRSGVSASRIHHFEEELESLNFALDWAQPGDLIIMLDLGRDPAVHERLTGASRAAD